MFDPPRTGPLVHADETPDLRVVATGRRADEEGQIVARTHAQLVGIADQAMSAEVFLVHHRIREVDDARR